jgi:glycerol-3-phosphate acyltransferase PlsX
MTETSQECAVVLDVASGGDDGDAALRAAAHASLGGAVCLTLVGDAELVTRRLAELPHDAERVRVLHAPDRISADLGAADALEAAPHSSVAIGLRETAREPGSIFVSAGHTGAIVLGAHRWLTPLPHVRRAALAAVYPTLRHRGETNDPFALLLDVGATVHCNGADLTTFAVMGAAYARVVSVNARPRVALLSNGPPAMATPAVREAHGRLAAMDTFFEYVGCVRADHVTGGDADVVVTDGFTGDVLVRTLEGVVATAGALLQRAAERFRWRLGMSMLGEGIERLRELTDWENYGGAPLLGFAQPVIVTQTNSGERALINAIRLATKLHRERAIAVVAERVAALGEGEHDDG